MDIVIVVAYILATTVLGIWFTRRQRNVSAYLVGDRDVSWWLVLVSIVATETSSVTFLSLPGRAFKRDGGNLMFLQLALGFVIGRVLIAWILLPQYFKGSFFSAYQLLKLRFNTTVQRTASGIFLLTRTVADGLRLYLAALLLEQCTGWNTGASALVIGVATMVYTYLGGVKAVIWTDVIQFVIYITGAVLAAICIVGQIQSGWDGFVAVGLQHDKFELFSFSADLTRDYTFWTGLIGGAFLTMASHGADQMMVQRYSVQPVAGRGADGAGGQRLRGAHAVLLFLLIGVGMYVLWQQETLVLPAQIKDDAVFGFFIVHFLPAELSACSSPRCWLPRWPRWLPRSAAELAQFVGDFYRPLRPGRSEDHYLLVSRLMTSVWGVTRIAVALLAVPLLAGSSVIDKVLLVAGFTTGMILGLFILGSMRRPVDSRAALAGLVVGFLTVLTVWLLSYLAWPWYAPLGTLVTVGTALLVDKVGFAHGSPGNGGPQHCLDGSGPTDGAANRSANER